MREEKIKNQQNLLKLRHELISKETCNFHDLDEK